MSANDDIVDAEIVEESAELAIIDDSDLSIDRRSEWSKTEDAKRGIRYDAPISRDEFNHLSVEVATLRNKVARLEEFMARMVLQQRYTGG